jgi:heme-degrading monooxygenase HmoA
VFARVSVYKGTEEQARQAVELFRADVLPWLREATGFRGALILDDREAERSLAITFWDSPETAADREKSGLALRDEVSATVGSELEAQAIYEVALTEGLTEDAPD